MTKKQHHPGMLIVTVLMVLCTAFIMASAYATFVTNHLPFALGHVPNGLKTYPAETGVLLVILAALMTTADFYCLRVLYAHTENDRAMCNGFCFAAWLVGLAVFMYGLSTQALTWAYFFALTLPPFICWLATSPKISVAGDAW